MHGQPHIKKDEIQKSGLQGCELCYVASKAGYWQVYVARFYIFLKIFVIFYIAIFFINGIYQ